MIKLFTAILLGSSFGNKLMLPSPSYSVEVGIKRKSFRLGIDTSYQSQDTQNAFRQGQTSLLSLIPTLTVSPPLKSNLVPYLGFGVGVVVPDRDIKTVPTPGWRQWESLENGIGYIFKGGVELRCSKSIYLKAGVKQLYFKTQLTEHRQQYPKHDDSLDFQRVKDVDLDTLTSEFGVMFKW